MSDTPRSISLYATTGVSIEVREDPDGSVVFTGQEMSGAAREYRYTYTVAAGAVQTLRSELDGAGDQDILELVDSRKETLLDKGEVAWLREHGVEGEFSSEIRG